jgi:hypothetical protein
MSAPAVVTDRLETPRRFGTRWGFGWTDWGVFYEKAPNVKAALAAFLILWFFGALSVPESSIRTLVESFRWTRCMVGFHRSGAAISTAALWARRPSAVADNGGFDLSSIDLFFLRSPT